MAFSQNINFLSKNEENGKVSHNFLKKKSVRKPQEKVEESKNLF